MTTVLENRMVIGEYYAPIPVPIDWAVCPVCGAKWERYPDGDAEIDGRPWESGMCSSPIEPNACGCWACAIDKADGETLARFIEEKRLQKTALEWALINDFDWRNHLNDEYVPALWDAMRAQLIREDVLRDYITDCADEAFLEWRLGVE